MSTSDFQTSRELRGLALPAVKGPGGYFESKREGAVAWGDLLLALLTPQGGRVMRRSFGSGVPDMLFEPVEAGEFQILDATIKDVASRLLPHVIVTRTEIEALRDGKGIQIHIRFRIATNRDIEQSQTVLIPHTFVSAGA